MTRTPEYFPMFTDISRKQVLIIGGGRIAARRTATLLSFSDHLTVVSPALCEALESLHREGKILWKQELFRPEHLKGAELVFACTDSKEVNDEICSLCKKRDIPVNVCSDKEKCDFYFPAVIRAGGVVIGITASGSDHALARKMREKIEKLLREEA